MNQTTVSLKRDATSEETEQALKHNMKQWNLNNPNFSHDYDFWKAKQTEAESEGYKSEVCKCGVVFLAFHHYCGCQVKDCPMSDGVTILERMQEK